MRNREIVKLAGVVVGAAGVLALGFVFKKFLASKKVEKFEEELVDTILENSPIREITQNKKGKSKKAKKVGAKTKSRKNSKLAVAKLGNSKKLLAVMKKGQEYTQVALENLSKIPYRSVRRYIEVLSKQGKILAAGYGKGKKFSRA